MRLARRLSATARATLSITGMAACVMRKERALSVRLNRGVQTSTIRTLNEALSPMPLSLSKLRSCPCGLPQTMPYVTAAKQY